MTRALVLSLVLVLAASAHADPDVRFHGGVARLGFATDFGPYRGGAVRSAVLRLGTLAAGLAIGAVLGEPGGGGLLGVLGGTLAAPFYDGALAARF